MRAEAKANGKEEDGVPKGEDEQIVKRRRLLEEAKDLDKDDSDVEEGSKMVAAAEAKVSGEDGGDTDEEEDESEEDESDDDEDDTQALLKELEKIKRERALEKERQVSAFFVSSQLLNNAVSLYLCVGSHACCRLYV
jgi:protein CWC15